MSFRTPSAGEDLYDYLADMFSKCVYTIETSGSLQSVPITDGYALSVPSMESSESEVTVDYFMARLRKLAPINTSALFSAGDDSPVLDWDESGYKFWYEFDEVSFTPGYSDTFGDGQNDTRVKIIEGGIQGRIGAGTAAINMVEAGHQPKRFADGVPWIIYGVNVESLYYPSDFHPIPPGMFYEIRLGENPGYKYIFSVYKDGHQDHKDDFRGAPIVEMRKHTYSVTTKDPEGNPETSTKTLYYFNMPGTHDGGCAPIPDD